MTDLGASLVDDTCVDAALGQPRGHHQASWARPHDENIDMVDFWLHGVCEVEGQEVWSVNDSMAGLVSRGRWETRNLEY